MREGKVIAVVWYKLGASLMVALGLALVLPEAIRSGGLSAWLLAVVIVVFPVGAAVEAASERRRGNQDAADALTRWTFELAAAIVLVAFLGSQK